MLRSADAIQPRREEANNNQSSKSESPILNPRIDPDDRQPSMADRAWALEGVNDPGTCKGPLGFSNTSSNSEAVRQQWPPRAAFSARACATPCFSLEASSGGRWPGQTAASVLRKPQPLHCVSAW